MQIKLIHFMSEEIFFFGNKGLKLGFYVKVFMNPQVHKCDSNTMTFFLYLINISVTLRPDTATTH